MQPGKYMLRLPPLSDRNTNTPQSHEARLAEIDSDLLNLIVALALPEQEDRVDLISMANDFIDTFREEINRRAPGRLGS